MNPTREQTKDLISRRKFLKAASCCGASVVLANIEPKIVAAVLTSAPKSGWFDRPMRWAQLTLVEDDPGRFSVQFWLDYFKRTHSDAACLSAGGCVAYYPTQIPFHHRSAWLR